MSNQAIGRLADGTEVVVSRVKPKRTPEQIAAEGRSPNRKPRAKWTELLTKKTLESTKRRIANGVAVGKTLEEASLDAGAMASSGKTMMAHDAAFLAAIEEAKAEYRRKAEGIIDENLEKVATEVVRLSTVAEDERTRLTGGLAILRGRGVLKGDGAVVAVNNDNRQVKIERVEIIMDGGKVVEERKIGN